MVLGGFVGSVLTGVRERVATVARRCAVPVRPMKGRLVRVWLVPRGRNARGHAGGRGRRAGRLPTRSRMGWRNGASGLCGDDFQASCTHPTLFASRATNVVVARGLSRLDELNILRGGERENGCVVGRRIFAQRRPVLDDGVGSRSARQIENTCEQ